jgi:hypothetical protein
MQQGVQLLPLLVVRSLWPLWHMGHSTHGRQIAGRPQCWRATPAIGGCCEVLVTLLCMLLVEVRKVWWVCLRCHVVATTAKVHAMCFALRRHAPCPAVSRGLGMAPTACILGHMHHPLGWQPPRNALRHSHTAEDGRCPAACLHWHAPVCSCATPRAIWGHGPVCWWWEPGIEAPGPLALSGLEGGWVDSSATRCTHAADLANMVGASLGPCASGAVVRVRCY